MLLLLLLLMMMMMILVWAALSYSAVHEQEGTIHALGSALTLLVWSYDL